MLEHDKRVHGADLGDIMLRAVQPEVLDVTLLRGLLLHHDAWCVVRTKFVGTDACVHSGQSREQCAPHDELASWGRAAVLGCAIQRDGLEALWVVRPHGTTDDEKQSFTRRRDTNELLSANCAATGLGEDLTGIGEKERTESRTDI